MEDFELTLLTYGEIWGNDSEEQLDVFKKYGTKSIATDLAVLCDIIFLSDCKCDLINMNQRVTTTADYWTKTNMGKNDMIICGWDGRSGRWDKSYRDMGVRPVLISSKIFQEVYSHKKLGEKDTFEVEYGEYPQTLVDSKTQVELEKIYLLEQLKKEEQRTKMKKTGKAYTFDSLPASPVNFDKPIRPICYDELIYNGQKYIRIWENCDRFLWVKVEPIVWLLDEKNRRLISKKVLLAGIRFAERLSESSEFSKTDMKYYLDTFMKYEILSHDSIEYVNEKLKEIENEKTRLEQLREKLLKTNIADYTLVRTK